MKQPYREPSPVQPMETVKKNVVFVRLTETEHQSMEYVEFSDVDIIAVQVGGSLELKGADGKFIVVFASGQWHSVSRNKKVEW